MSFFNSLHIFPNGFIDRTCFGKVWILKQAKRASKFSKKNHVFSRLNRIFNSLIFLKQAIWYMKLWSNSYHFLDWMDQFKKNLSNSKFETFQMVASTKPGSEKFKLLSKLWEFQKFWKDSSLFLDWIKTSTVGIFLSKLFDNETLK